ncbi:MAG: phosphoribosylglycinamide formyltransferase [Verrucomicrobia bacterium]|nr:phosphoribosylglycinamide formyltransferase [Verrucomicrobiota bacterium]MCH8514469.1 phosphoribosylglycinamide formyltransferase [Kiritimatiellia bacterium]
MGLNTKLGVLASGRGSNFQAIQKEIEAGTLDAEIAVLISDRAQAPALEIAAAHGIDAHALPYDKNNREAFERAAGDLLEQAGCEWIVLAGFMRILTPYFINRFAGRILNIHPSLLPDFKGLHPQRQALEAGVKTSGCTVHLVTQDLDAGPIITQSEVPVLENDTEETLAARILVQEHRAYPEAIRILQKKREEG